MQNSSESPMDVRANKGIKSGGPSWPGPMCGSTRGGRYKKCGTKEVIRAQRGRARSALFH